MRTRVVPLIYERYWRPLLAGLAKGVTGPTTAQEYRLARELLAVRPGDTVLDVACGPGNFTRELARAAGPDGLVVGLDASPPMLERAVAGTSARNVAYVRGDAVELPFSPRTFDAVCCFLALNMFDEPFRALDRMAGVLAPGGRIAIMTSCARGPEPLHTPQRLVGALAGMRVFTGSELVYALADRGFTAIRRRAYGLTQIIGARLTP
ncbi:methyltransferase domain-containing protein [Bailinhaonella thermotolerans]|uniref:Methyltransferase domain-containing protein n=2 Tax=Bailinhaonella thermotolerans TaxID=1070861 RepID=A0A3A4AUN1_9ACTN|nr:methyltransferase domain-containing protein [Bailinhaonella thermotolerans]